MMRADVDKAIAPWANHFTRAVAEVGSDLETFETMLSKWQAAQNLVSRETLDAFWSRHIADSLQILPLLPQGAVSIFDLGSGGGFPGLPLSIALKGAAAQFSLCESNARKTAFLRAVNRELGLEAKVLQSRIEAIDSRETGQADAVLARALAPLNRLFELAFPLLSPDGILVVHKGRENGAEIDQADADWRFDVVKHQSATSDDGVVLEISNLRPKS